MIVGARKSPSRQVPESLETLHDHPDADKVIAQAMGWNRIGGSGGDWIITDSEELDGTEMSIQSMEGSDEDGEAH